MKGFRLIHTFKAKHLGIARTYDESNSSAIMDIMAAQNKALYSVLSVDHAKDHKANPAASLKVLDIYSTPIILNGITSLYLSNNDIELLVVHNIRNLQRLIRLHTQAPAPVLHLLPGLLPIKAQIHICHFTTLLMIDNLGPLNLLYQIASNLLKQGSEPWFT